MEEAYRHEYYDTQDIRLQKGVEIDDRRVLLAITVEIEDGCVEHIEMREGDSAEAVAIKFCQDHNLPQQFVAPLTEHIVSNIVNIGVEEKELIYDGKDQVYSSHESWIREQHREASAMESRLPPPKYHCTYEQGDRFISSCGRSCGSKQHGAAAFGEGDFMEGSSDRRHIHHGILVKKPTAKVKQKFSDRVLAPTLTSLAKRPQAQEKDKKKDFEKIAHRPLSEKAKAVYTRLYAEFLRQKERNEMEQARNEEMYQEKLEKDRAYVSKKSWRVWRMRGRTAKQYRNYGELLYCEGLHKKEQLKKLIQKKQEEDEMKEMKELTLTPEISKRAKQIRRDQGQIWFRLQGQDKPREDQLQDLRNEIWESKLMECTFKPRINQRRFSEKLLHDGKDSSTTRFDQLFLDAENRRRRQAEYMQWYPEGVTFRPHINRKRLTNGLDIDGEFQHEGTVFDRLLHYASKMVEKKQICQQEASKPIDPSTGQELFTPSIGRKPIFDRNTNDLPIGEFLYQLKSSMDKKKELLAQSALQQKKEQASCQYVNPKSQRLIENIRERRFLQIFEYLDQDKDGFVELETADLNHLADDVVEDVVRLKKMVGGGKTLNLQSFVDAMKAIQEHAHKPSSDLVVKHKHHDDNSTQQPQFKMDHYSRNLAHRRRRFNTSRQWYRLILADKAKWQADIEAMRKERESLEMKECTFKPKIQKRSTTVAHEKVFCAGDDQYYNPPTIPQAKILERNDRGMHAFIFQEELNQKHERLEDIARDLSHESRCEALKAASHAHDFGPDSLLESLNSLKQIVSQPVDSICDGSPRPQQPELVGREVPKAATATATAATTTSTTTISTTVSYHHEHCQSLKHKVEVEKLISGGGSTAVCDLPEVGDQKEGLFIGVMGA